MTEERLGGDGEGEDEGDGDGDGDGDGESCCGEPLPKNLNIFSHTGGVTLRETKRERNFEFMWSPFFFYM